MTKLEKREILEVNVNPLKYTGFTINVEMLHKNI